MNAKEELLRILSDNNLEIKCASIDLNPDYEDEKEVYDLKLNYTDEEYQKFIESLNFEYNNGFGGQELFGIVWLKDGTWLSRGEYDGSEWWEHNVLPEIPKELL